MDNLLEKNIQGLTKKIDLICSRCIYVALILIPFVASFSSAAVTVLSIQVIVLFLVKRAFNKDFSFVRNVIKLPFLLIAFFSLISFAETVSLRASVQGIWKLFYYGSLFTIILEELKDLRHARRIIISALLGLFFASLDGIWQLYFGWDLYRHHFYRIQAGMGLPRIRAAFPHTNIFAAYLVLLLPLAVTVFLFRIKKKFKRVAYLSVVILGLFCLAFTFARGAALGLIVVLLIIAILRKNKPFLIFLICSFFLAPLVMPESIKSWAGKAESVWDILLNPERIGDYRNALNIIRHHPFRGVGVNTYSLNIEKYKIRDNSRNIGDAGYSHNIYLHMGAEIGMFGLFSFLWLIWRLLRHGLKRYRLAKEEFIKISILGLMAGISAFLINGLTETVLYYPKVAVLFWFEVGLLLGIIKLSERV